MNQMQNEQNNSTPVTLDGVQVTQEQFNEQVKNLKSNQRIAETDEHQFVVIERLFG